MLFRLNSLQYWIVLVFFGLPQNVPIVLLSNLALLLSFPRFLPFFVGNWFFGGLRKPWQTFHVNLGQLALHLHELFCHLGRRLLNFAVIRENGGLFGLTIENTAHILSAALPVLRFTRFCITIWCLLHQDVFFYRIFDRPLVSSNFFDNRSNNHHQIFLFLMWKVIRRN